MSSSTRTGAPATERVVAFTAAGLAVVAFCCLLAVLLAPLFGVPSASLTAPGWQVVFLVAYFGFPLAIALVLGLIVSRILQNRRRHSRG